MTHINNFDARQSVESQPGSLSVIASFLKDALRDRAHIETTDGRFVIVHDPMQSAEECQRFVQDVLDGKYDFNLLTAHRRQKEKHYSELRLVLRRLNQFPGLYTPGFQYHPCISFLFEVYRLHSIAHCGETGQPRRVLNDGRTVAELFQDFVNVLKTKAVECRLRKKISNHEGKVNKNLKRLKYWETELFRRCSRPVIIRLDLEYHASLVRPEECTEGSAEHPFDRVDYNEIFSTGEDLEGRVLPPMRVGFKEVQADREKFFDNMKGKTSLFEHLVGYVWRFEHTLQAGYHLHLVLAFDGAQVRKHEWLGQMIGRYWEDEITEGRGRFHNCNMAWKKTSPQYGIGVIHWSNEAVRANLRDHVLPYLAKRGQYVLALPYKGCKLMGSGFVHRAKDESRGRPRLANITPPPPPHS